MIKKINGEIWKPLKFKGWQSMRNKYALSSLGRAASYREDIYEDGKTLEGSITSGYKTLNLRVGGGSGTIYLHREIAKLFNPKNSSKQKYVIHLNHDKTDNNSSNLQWSSQKEMIDHQQQSPQKLAYKKIQNARGKGLKLNATQVKAIKTILANPKRKLTYQQMAEKYHVSVMTVYRIKKGENWKSV